MDHDTAINLIKDTFNHPFNEEKFSNFSISLLHDVKRSDVTNWQNNSNLPSEIKNQIIEYKIFGKLNYENGEKIVVAIAKLKSSKIVEKSRLTQRNFAKYVLEITEADACLVSFFAENYEDWRFSFVNLKYDREISEQGKIKIKKLISNFKRFSYLVGKNEPNNTAKLQIVPLLLNKKVSSIEEIERAFSVEKVTDNFFNDYKNLFLDLSQEIDALRRKDKKIGKDFKENEIDTENFSKKTLGQIVFLFFLQKKGWLGIERNLNNNFKNWGSGSKNFISELFQKYEDKKIEANNFYNDILEPIFYDALNNPEDFYEKLDCKMPFLNGGLFEPINGYNWYETNILIKDATIKKILNIFNQYNFTITEDQPLDREVAVDPEMLGKVFEKLLNEKERKKGGAHYTPREVVQYMCKKSLFYFLQKNVDNEINQNEFDILLSLSENPDNENLENLKVTKLFKKLSKISDSLENIKICDPAIGSGAFPVSMMILISNIISLIGNILKTEKDIYDIKRNFIESNLYGVDVDSGAVDIAKLRLWLSLVIDEKSFEKINPLPNLDYKIMQGNSLVESIYDIDFSYQRQSSLLDFANENLSTDLFKLLDQYYNSSIRKNKNKLKVQIKEGFVNLTNSLIESSGKKFSKKKIDLIKKNSEEIFDDKKERDYFLWNIFFHEVFKKKGGFDIIIANPPYIKEYTDRNAFSKIKDHEYYQGKMDLWYFMACKSIDHLNSNGILCFIAQNNWFTNSGAKKFRNKIANDTRILEINDFVNYMIFESADQQTMIMVLNKETEEKQYKFKHTKIKSNEFSKRDLNNFLKNDVTTKVETNVINFERIKMIDQSFNFNSTRINKILNKIENVKNFYLKDNDLTNGIHPHHSKVSKKHEELSKGKFIKGSGIFVLNKMEIKKLNFLKEEKNNLKPVFFSENLKKFYSKEVSDEFIIYTSSEFNSKKIISKLPNIKLHLDKYKSIITSDFKPYGLHRKRNEQFFKGEKIASLRKCVEPKFTYTDYDCYLLADHYIIKTNRINLKYLTLYLNSKLVKFWFRYRGKMQGTNFQIDAEPLLRVPLYLPKELKKYLDIFERIKKNYTNKEKISELEKKFNDYLYLELKFSKDEKDMIENDKDL